MSADSSPSFDPKYSQEKDNGEELLKQLQKYSRIEGDSDKHFPGNSSSSEEAKIVDFGDLLDLNSPLKGRNVEISGPSLDREEVPSFWICQSCLGSSHKPTCSVI